MKALIVSIESVKRLLEKLDGIPNYVPLRMVVGKAVGSELADHTIREIFDSCRNVVNEWLAKEGYFYQ